MDKLDVESRLLKLTDAEDIDKAFEALEEMKAVIEQLKYTGMVCFLIGPGGIKQSLLSDRFLKEPEALAALQSGLLSFQADLVEFQRKKMQVLGKKDSVNPD